MDGAAILTLVVGGISCLVAVLTFITARISRAENNGRFAEKLDNCINGIEEIKSKLDRQEAAQNQQSITLAQHGQRIESLEARVESLERRMILT